MTSVHDTLVKAREVYEANPTIGYHYDEENGCYCAVGAILCALGHEKEAANKVTTAAADVLEPVQALADALAPFHTPQHSYAARNWGLVTSVADRLPFDEDERVTDPAPILAGFDRAIAATADPEAPAGGRSGPASPFAHPAVSQQEAANDC